VDSTGNLIGVSNGNGASGAGQSGAIYRLTPPATAGGAWTEQVLALFVGPPEQGHAPQSLVLDPTGVIYAALLSGGTDNNGQIVQLAPPASGTGLWTTTVLLNFTRGKGAAGGVYPNWITETAPGTLTGTTGGGGANKAGTFFRLSNSTGTWAETVLYSFGATPTDATHPNGHLYTDTDGSLLGTAAGGAHAEGTIFRLSQSGGVYANTVLYSFSGGATGNGPKSALISNGNGAFFGNTFGGGTMNRGTVYVFTP
jgi:hypothetical protein